MPPKSNRVDLLFMNANIRFYYVVLIECFALLVISLIADPLAIGHDAAYFLAAGQMFIDGKRPFLEILDTNPPLAIYLHAIPAWLSAWTGMPVIPVFSILVIGLITYSVAVPYRIFKKSGLNYQSENLAILLLAWLGYSVLVRIVSIDNFGQREHLFMLVFFPFVLVRWIRWRGGAVELPLALIVGFLAGAGACLKPNFVVIWLLVEVAFFFHYRSMRRLLKSDMVAFVCAGLAYAVHFLVMPEVQQSALFNHWLPFIAVHYSVYEVPFLEQKNLGFVVLCAVSGFVIAWMPRFRKGVFGGLVQVIGVMTAAGLGSFLAQHKGWSYQAIPIFSGVALLAGCVLVEFKSTVRHFAEERIQPKSLKFVRILIHGSILAGMLLILYRGLASSPNPLKPAPVATVISRYSNPGDAILVVSTSVEPAFPLLVQMGRKPASRYLCSFMIPMFYEGKVSDSSGVFPYHTEDVPLEESRFLSAMADDVKTTRPPLIFIVTGPCQALPEGFDLVDYLKQTGFVDSAMNDYVRLEGAASRTVAFVRKDKLANL